MKRCAVHRLSCSEPVHQGALQGKAQNQKKLEASYGQSNPLIGELPDNHEGYPAKLHHMCNDVEGKTQRAVVQSKQSLPLGLQSRHTTGIKEGEQESQSLPAILACPQR